MVKMPHTQTKTLLEASVLLTAPQKAAMERLLPGLNAADESALQDLLREESDVLMELAEHVLDRAAQEGNEELLKRCTKFLAQSKKHLSVTAEASEREDEGKVLDGLFTSTD